MTRKSRKACVAAVLAVLALAGFATMLSLFGPGVGPLCFSDGWVRARIIKRTPLGSSTDQVLTVISKYHWVLSGEVCPPMAVGGTWIDGLGNIGWIGPGPTVGGGYIYERDVGITHVYDPPFETDVIAFWIFGKNGHLIEVKVTHDTDSL